VQPADPRDRQRHKTREQMRYPIKRQRGILQCIDPALFMAIGTDFAIEIDR